MCIRDRFPAPPGLRSESSVLFALRCTLISTSYDDTRLLFTMVLVNLINVMCVASMWLGTVAISPSTRLDMLSLSCSIVRNVLLRLFKPAILSYTIGLYMKGDALTGVLPVTTVANYASILFDTSV